MARDKAESRRRGTGHVPGDQVGLWETAGVIPVVRTVPCAGEGGVCVRWDDMCGVYIVTPAQI